MEGAGRATSGAPRMPAGLGCAAAGGGCLACLGLAPLETNAGLPAGCGGALAAPAPCPRAGLPERR